MLADEVRRLEQHVTGLLSSGLTPKALLQVVELDLSLRGRLELPERDAAEDKLYRPLLLCLWSKVLTPTHLHSLTGANRWVGLQALLRAAEKAARLNFNKSPELAKAFSLLHNLNLTHQPHSIVPLLGPHQDLAPLRAWAMETFDKLAATVGKPGVFHFGEWPAAVDAARSWFAKASPRDSWRAWRRCAGTPLPNRWA